YLVSAKGLNDQSCPRHALHMQLVTQTGKLLPADLANVSPIDDAAKAMENVDKTMIAPLESRLKELVPTDPQAPGAEPQLTSVCKLCANVLDKMARPAQKFVVMTGALATSAPQNIVAWRTLIINVASQRNLRVERARVPLTAMNGGPYKPEYTPAVV